MKRKKEKKIINSKIKIIGIILLSLIGASVIGFGVFNYLKSKENTIDRTINNVAVYYGIFDDGTYYIPKANKDVEFPIKENNKDSYKLTDEDGKKVSSEIIKKKDNYYIKSKNSYEDGKTYNLELTDNTFNEKTLRETNKIQFKIEEKEKQEYELSDNTIYINQKNIDVIDDNTIKINKGNVKKNQIILVKDNDKVVNAYKITELNNDTASVETPEIAEIYDELDVYIEDKIDFSKLEINKNLGDQIAESVKKSTLIQYLVRDVYALDVINDKNLKISYENDNGVFKANVTVKFKADGKDKIGIEALKQHDLTLNFSFELSADYIAKIDKDNAFNFDMAVSKKSAVNIKLTSSNPYLSGIQGISDEEYSKSIEEIVKKLQKEVPDVSKNSINIGAVEVPTNVPLLNVYMDVYFQCQLEIQTNLNVSTTEETIEHIGFVIGKDETKAYKNLSKDEGKFGITILGKEEIRVGVGLDVGVSFINKNIAHAGIGLEIGAYQEAFATATLDFESTNNHLNTNLIAKLEMGVYLTAKIDAGLDVKLFKKNFSKNLEELKEPIIQFGSSEIITSISSTPSTLVIQDGNKINRPKIVKNIVDLDTGDSRQEDCETDNVRFEDMNGNYLASNSTDINIGKDEDMKIYAVYENDFNIYKTVLTIYKKGSNVVESTIDNSNNGISSNLVGSLSINDDNDAIKAYKQYILDKKHLNDYKEYLKNNFSSNTNLYDMGYCIFDINKDGIPELIIDATFDYKYNEWKVDNIYTYSNGTVVKVDSLNAFRGIRYEYNNHEVVYTMIRANSVTAVYDFYKLVGTNLVKTKSVGHDRGYYDIYTGEYEYDNHMYFENDNTTYITEEQERAYFNNVVSFSYQNINNVK